VVNLPPHLPMPLMGKQALSKAPKGPEQYIG